MTTKQNITLAIIGSYCYIDNLVWNDNGSLVSNFTLSREMGIKQLGLNGGFTYFYDLGVQMGLDYVNANESILPGFHLNVKRFSDCGAYYPAVESFNGNSGGYAQAVTAIDVVGSKDVIGAVGIEYSTLAKGLAEILSNSKIPYCTPASGSPSFTDRNDYPYFFRTFLTFGGAHVSTVEILECQTNCCYLSKGRLSGESICPGCIELYVSSLCCSSCQTPNIYHHR
ncbi:hypothetical protein BCR33DRAFT_451181 [Rhizoclosmatium globosum]|uniref:Receptor ligand binding region domain-containing protein n=1 Tax=Rhizoclosmatium globosum TaxID=329046 RepID=A0A1Y2CW72_9FUNG|nr:hypothetical protein BCR33DRAFT_451181 [Rhizoclosmatium globosum]|eukprot:ORY51272.1 hypothetical protein BCR33DRAFT_451181 [Rhizoclosmatium globosum]